MSLYPALILGIIEGVTEFLPVSSTGHLVLATKVMGLSQSDFLKSFDIVIQAGAILAVVFLYWKELLTNRTIMKRLAAAFIPTMIIGLLLYKVVKSVFLGWNNLIAGALLAGGVFLIVFELLYREKEDAVADMEKISYGQSFIIGLFQSLALVPGVSRSAATVIGGLFLGLKRKTIVEFSFLLAVPTMLAAVGLDLVKSAPVFSAENGVFLAAGFVTSFLVAVASIKFLLVFIQKNNFIPFGVYRIIAACLFFFYSLR